MNAAACTVWENEVPSLVLGWPRGEAVAHLVLRVRPGAGGEALLALRRLVDAEVLKPSFGPDAPPPKRYQVSFGFTWRGLQALGVPRPYLRTFARLAPAFAAGAPLRAQRLGDSGASSPARWASGFGLHEAHVLLSVHGPELEVRELGEALVICWGENGVLARVDQRFGRRLGAPPGESGEWVHFGYRDGITDHRIEGVTRHGAPAPVERVHRAGEFILGHPNDADGNRFALPDASDKVRSFFHHGSFAAYRPMSQDVGAFEDFVANSARQAPPKAASGAAWVKAKLCGRWPGGEALHPGQLQPVRGDFALDFAADPNGEGCPFASHVRRMRPVGIDAHARERPLIRRSMPYGPAAWAREEGAPVDRPKRGLLGLFFCASLEDQFEHLLGQWANRRPLGSPDRSRAKDPLMGAHEDEHAAMILPAAGAAPLVLSGFRAWTRTLGTLYAWYPGKTGLDRLLQSDYTRPEDEGPWL
ncbi:MAG: hypothetical protein JSR75_12015 [Proteobacteria bacterium]|nr:hypothetical protein [Pseudomonadota bacterium]